MSLIYSARGPGVRLRLAVAQGSYVSLTLCSWLRHFCPTFLTTASISHSLCWAPQFLLYLSTVPVEAGWLLSAGTRHPKAGESLKCHVVVRVGSSNRTHVVSAAPLGNTSLVLAWSVPHQVTECWCGYSQCVTEATCTYLWSRIVFPLSHALTPECCLLLWGAVKRATKVGVPFPFPLLPFPGATSHPMGHGGEAAPLLYSLSKTLGAIPTTVEQSWTVVFFCLFVLNQIFQRQKLLVNRKENFT